MMALVRLPLSLAVLIFQSAVLALGQIWANKTRSLLTTIGIVIGVASVTAVIAALTGLKKNVLAEFESLGTNKMFIYPHWNGGRVRHLTRNFWQHYGLHVHDFDGMLDHCPSVKALTRQCSISGDVS